MCYFGNAVKHFTSLLGMWGRFKMTTEQFWLLGAENRKRPQGGPECCRALDSVFKCDQKRAVAATIDLNVWLSPVEVGSLFTSFTVVKILDQFDLLDGVKSITVRWFDSESSAFISPRTSSRGYNCTKRPLAQRRQRRFLQRGRRSHGGNDNEHQ